MKYLFLAIAGFLSLASLGVYRSLPNHESTVPVIWWVTDPNPIRTRQVDGFHRWLKEHGHTTASGDAAMQCRLDAVNFDDTKQIIQGVSGVGADVIDLRESMRYFQSIGLLTNLTDTGRELGFDPSQTWPAIVPGITIDGEQYAYPCNVAINMFWVNKATFAKYGVPLPPNRWTLDQFEQIGRQFISAAVKPGEQQTIFFTYNVNTLQLHRSLGLSRFNETLTHCTLDDDRYAQVLALKHKWMYEDRLLPTLADQASFDTQAGFGGAPLQLFNRGNYAMVEMGRFALIQLRQFGNLDLTVVEPPHGGTPNTLMLTRCAGIYAASRHPELAEYFLAYLASEDYNMQVVRDADALPPNPIYTHNEAFLHPPDYPNEWQVHEAFADAANTIAVSAPHCPYVLDNIVDRLVTDAEKACMSGRLTPQQAAMQAYERIEAEITRTLEEQPALRERYDELLADQATIDRLRSEGKPVPAALIRNPFYLYYYRTQGWLEQ